MKLAAIMKEMAANTPIIVLLVVRLLSLLTYIYFHHLQEDEAILSSAYALAT
jgi:hypothetical protein